MPGTTDLGLPIPEDSDALADVYEFIRELAAAVDHKVVRKTADEDVNNSTVLQNDNELFFDVVAGKSYVFELVLAFTINDSSVDAKVGFTFPTGSMAFGVMALEASTPTGLTGEATFAAKVGGASGAAVDVGVGAASAPDATLVRISGSFTATNSGVVQLQWAQKNATANNLKLKAGSYMTVRAA